MTAPSSVDHLYQNNADLKAVYQHLIDALSAIGPIKVAPKQTSIHIEKNSGFAGAHPRKNYFNLEFRTDYKIDAPRVVRQQQLSARRFEHTVKIEKTSDVDEQLLKWLKDAYDLSK